MIHLFQAYSITPMKIFHTFLLGLLLLSAFALPSYGQDDAKTLEKLTRDFATAYHKVTTTKDKNSVLKYLDPKLTSLLINTNILDKVSNLRSDYNGFDQYLTQIISTEGMKINYVVKDISRSYVSGNTGVVVYSVAFENIRDKEIWVKGNETVTMVFRKTDDDWKVIHYTVVGFEDEKFKGPCFCELFASTANFVAKTTIPQGKGYSTENLMFSFTIMDNKQFILLDQRPFLWESNGNVWEMSDKNEPKRKLGVASERPEAVYTIVKDLFKEPCASFKVKF